MSCDFKYYDAYISRIYFNFLSDLSTTEYFVIFPTDFIAGLFLHPNLGYLRSGVGRDHYQGLGGGVPGYLLHHPEFLIEFCS